MSAKKSVVGDVNSPATQFSNSRAGDEGSFPEVEQPKISKGIDILIKSSPVEVHAS